MSPVDVVLIGRNEGARLIRALEAVAQSARQVVYVDSGSTDDSVAAARARGAAVVELDMSIPFTAARARNAGFAALTDPVHVQFIDGDCALVPGFLETASSHLDAHPELGLVTGWRAEIFPDASIYNLLCHWEWRQPAGPITNCGGDMMVRADAFAAIGGFNPGIIAAEDDDFCLRLGQAGWGLERLAQEMTRHDADMHSFGQWWQRAKRAGHGFAQIGRLHPPHFRTEQRRVLLYGLVLPLLSLIWLPWSLLAGLAIYAVNFLRTRSSLAKDPVTSGKAGPLAALLTLSKIPNFLGMLTYHWRRLTGRDMRLIEYK